MSAQTVRFVDKSITSLSGSSQQAIGVNPHRQILIIANTGTANAGVNPTGGTAAIGGPGTLTIDPAGSLILDRVVPQNAITVIGTATQPLIILEG